MVKNLIVQVKWEWNLHVNIYCKIQFNKLEMETGFYHAFISDWLSPYKIYTFTMLNGLIFMELIYFRDVSKTLNKPKRLQTLKHFRYIYNFKFSFTFSYTFNWWLTTKRFCFFSFNNTKHSSAFILLNVTGNWCSVHTVHGVSISRIGQPLWTLKSLVVTLWISLVSWIKNLYIT